MRIGHGEVAWRADDAVEVGAEVDFAAEDALVHGAIDRCFMDEADAPRLPVWSEEAAHQLEQQADGELGALAHVDLIADQQLFAQHRDVGRLLDPDHERLVEQAPVTGHRLDGLAQRRLLAREHAERPEARNLAGLRHQQPETFDTTAMRRRLDQPARGFDRHHQVGFVETARRDAELAQQHEGIEPGVACDVGKAGQAATTDEIGHRRRPESPNGKPASRDVNASMPACVDIGRHAGGAVTSSAMCARDAHPSVQDDQAG